MDAVYEVYHEEDGEFIGHGLYETHEVVDSVHATEESAKAEAERLHKETGRTYYVYKQEVKP